MIARDPKKRFSSFQIEECLAKNRIVHRKAKKDLREKLSRFKVYSKMKNDFRQKKFLMGKKSIRSAAKKLKKDDFYLGSSDLKKGLKGKQVLTRKIGFFNHRKKNEKTESINLSLLAQKKASLKGTERQKIFRLGSKKKITLTQVKVPKAKKLKHRRTMSSSILNLKSSLIPKKRSKRNSEIIPILPRLKKNSEAKEKLSILQTNQEPTERLKKKKLVGGEIPQKRGKKQAKSKQKGKKLQLSLLVSVKSRQQSVCAKKSSQNALSFRDLEAPHEILSPKRNFEGRKKRSELGRSYYGKFMKPFIRPSKISFHHQKSRILDLQKRKKKKHGRAKKERKKVENLEKPKTVSFLQRINFQELVEQTHFEKNSQLENFKSKLEATNSEKKSFFPSLSRVELKDFGEGKSGQKADKYLRGSKYGSHLVSTKMSNNSLTKKLGISPTNGSVNFGQFN